MSAIFSIDVASEPQYLDVLGIAAGYGVLSVPVSNFFDGDMVDAMLLSIQGDDLTTISTAIDQVQRSQGYLEWTTQSSVSGHFTLTSAQIAAIAAATNCTYSVTVQVTRSENQYSREVQSGNISTRVAPPSPPLIVATIQVSGGPVIGNVGSMTQLGAVAYDGLGNVVPGVTFVWSSSDEDVATVDADGLVTIEGLGGATITVSTYGVSALTIANGTTTPFAVGAVVYAETLSTLGFLPIGTAGQYLKVNPGATAPLWDTLTAADIGAGIFQAGTMTFGGNVLFGTDNAYDIGATGATRPRDVYVGRNVVVGGNITISGSTTFGGLTYTWPGSQTANRVLKTDGAGNLSWSTPVEEVSLTDLTDVTISGAANGQVLRYNSGSSLWENSTDGSALTALNATSLASGTVASARIAGAYTGIIQVGTLASDLLFIDASYDIGKVGATRPRDIFASRNIAVGGTLAVTGTTTLGVLDVTTLTTATIHATGASTLDGNVTTLGTYIGNLSKTLAFGTHLTGTAFNNSADVTIATDAVATNTVSTIVARDGSGNFAAGTITASLTGHASLDLPLTGGTMAGNLLFNDALYDVGATGANRPRSGFFSANVTVGGVFIGALTSALTFGTHLQASGTSYNNTAAVTIATDATSTNTTSTIVARDSSGNFSAATISAILNGAAPAGSLSGAALATGVTASSLTSFGTLAADLLFLDGTYDIGKSGATRPRDAFLSRNLLVGGTATIANLITTLSLTILATVLTLGSDGSGLDNAAADVFYAGPKSTGSATPAGMNFQTTRVGASGTALQTLYNVMRLLSDTMHLGQDASGANGAATAFIMSAPISTGNATPATLTLQTTHVGSTGSTPQTLENLLILGDRAITALSTSTFTLGASSITTTTITGTNVTATTLTGTLATAAQPNVTSIGTLAADLLFVDATYDIGKTGATRPRDGFFSRNVTIGGTVAAGGTTVTTLHASSTSALDGDVTLGANIVFSAAAGRLIPGATSFSLRNNANGADNILITDAGDVTFRATVGGITTLTATTLAGTLSTAAQPNITSIGTLAADLLFTDATYDIGKTGATRPRDGFFSRNVVIGGTLAVTGNITLSGTTNAVGTITSGTWNGSVVGVAFGGTGLSSYTIGDLVYASGATAISKLGIGTGSQFLQVNGGATAPQWHTLVTADITDIASAATGITKVGALNTGSIVSGFGGASFGGNVIATTDATYDLGATGANRFRDAFLSRNLTIGNALTYGGVALSAAVTGTGNMVLSAGPTFTGTITASALTTSGIITANAAINGTTATFATQGTTLTLGVSSANGGAALTFLGATSGIKNWRVDTNVTSGSDQLSFTPSTANGGTTFSTPVLSLNASGAVGFTGAVSGITTLASGAITASGNVIAGTDATYDFGASGANRFRDGFFSRNLTIGSTFTATSIGGTISTATQNSITTMTALTSVGALASGSIAAGFGSARFGGNVLANTDAAYDIGAVGATRFRNFFLSGDATIGGSVDVTGNVKSTGGFYTASGTQTAVNDGSWYTVLTPSVAGEYTIECNTNNGAAAGQWNTSRFMLDDSSNLVQTVTADGGYIKTRASGTNIQINYPGGFGGSLGIRWSIRRNGALSY